LSRNPGLQIGDGLAALLHRRLELGTTVRELQELLIEQHGSTQLGDLPIQLELAAARCSQL
jgi:hypothetical protein